MYACSLLDPGVILNGRARTGDRTRSRKPSNAPPSGDGLSDARDPWAVYVAQLHQRWRAHAPQV